MQECFICSESLDPKSTPYVEHADVDVSDTRPPPLAPGPDVPCDCAKHNPTHPTCYDAWFQRHASCPVCRTPSANAELVRVVRIQVAAALATQDADAVEASRGSHREHGTEDYTCSVAFVAGCLLVLILVATALILIPDGVLSSAGHDDDNDWSVDDDVHKYTYTPPNHDTYTPPNHDTYTPPNHDTFADPFDDDFHVLRAT